MFKLLNANFSRLLKDKIFIFSSIITFLVGGILPIIHYFDNINYQADWKIDSTAFASSFLIPIMISFIVSLFIGLEYSDGTIRNKIIVGHKRENIYISNLILSIIAGFFLLIIYIISHSIFGILLLGKFVTQIKTVLLYVGLNFTLIIAFSSILTLIATLCQNKSHSVAISILLVFSLLIMGVYLIASLQEKEYYEAYSYTENGVTHSEKEMKNPNYVGGNKRKIYEFLVEFTPGGQAIKLSNVNSMAEKKLAIYDFIILFLTIVFGLIFYKDKDLK